MKNPARTARAGSGLRALALAARTVKEARPAFREEMRRRTALALDGLGLSAVALGEAMAMDPKRVARYRDPGPDGLAAPWWGIATLPPTAFHSAVAALRELHGALHSEAEPMSREQHCVVAMQALTATCSMSNGALSGDLRIDAEEARAILPMAQRAYRLLRAYIVALGGDPDAEGEE